MTCTLLKKHCDMLFSTLTDEILLYQQTNVVAKAQQIKMEAFKEFKTKAVVVIPTFENLRKRIGEKRQRDGEDVPFMPLAEMKCESLNSFDLISIKIECYVCSNIPKYSDWLIECNILQSRKPFNFPDIMVDAENFCERNFSACCTWALSFIVLMENLKHSESVTTASFQSLRFSVADLWLEQTINVEGL